MKRAILSFFLAAPLALAAVTYSYDGAGRLAAVDYGDGRTIVYTYDPAGNLLSRTTTAAAAAASAEKTPRTAAAPEETKEHQPAKRVTESSPGTRK